MTDAEIARLRSALAFYADRNSYRWQPSNDPPVNAWQYPVIADSGRRARIALGMEREAQS